MRCTVCTKNNGERRETLGGDFYGNACKGECAALVWESHFIRASNGTDADHSLVLWKMKRRRAEVLGEPFTEPMPVDSIEQAFEELLERRPDLAALWKEIRELE